MGRSVTVVGNRNTFSQTKQRSFRKIKTFLPASTRTGREMTWTRWVPAQHVGMPSGSLWACRVMRCTSSRDRIRAPTYIFAHFSASLAWLRLEREVLQSQEKNFLFYHPQGRCAIFVLVPLGDFLLSPSPTLSKWIKTDCFLVRGIWTAQVTIQLSCF